MPSNKPIATSFDNSKQIEVNFWSYTDYNHFKETGFKTDLFEGELKSEGKL